MGKHDKTEFRWTTPTVEPETISYDPPKDDFYKARITTLEKENRKLREELDNRAKWYGTGKDTFNEKLTELHKENEKLADENWKLRNALIREAIRDVEV